MTVATDKAVVEERRQRRRLQFMMDLTLATIAQTPIAEPEAWELIRSAKVAALQMFPGKDLAFELIYMSRFRRLMEEKYGRN